MTPGTQQMPLWCVNSMAGGMLYQPWAVFILEEDLGPTVWLDNINCNGMERLLSECSSQERVQLRAKPGGGRWDLPHLCTLDR